MNFQWMFNFLSPAGDNARLSVFIYHRVLTAPDTLFPGELDITRFELQMRWIKSWFTVLPLAEAVKRLQAGDLPARAAAITFDDGYADNYTNALPVLTRFGLTATFFVATGYLNGGRMWNDTVIEVVRNAQGAYLDLTPLGLDRHGINTIEGRQGAVKKLLNKIKYLDIDRREEVCRQMAAIANICPSNELMMTAQQVRLLADSGMSIGAHTVRHPILSQVDEQTARAEMLEGKRQLEEITGREVTLFAYPNGKPNVDYQSIHVRMARDAGFGAAVSTSWGVATRFTDIYQIPRFTPWDRTRWRYAARLAANIRRTESVA